MKFKFHKNKKKIIKIAVIICILLVLFLFFKNASSKAIDSMYTKESVQKRDIETYHSFTGTVSASTSVDITPTVSGVKVEEIKVEDGDEVSKGDVIMVLDSYSIETQIEELSAQMDTSANQNAISIAQAQKSYDDLKDNMDKGLNQTIQSAQSGIDSAFQALVSAQNAYNNEVTLNNMQLSTTISSSMQSVDSAYAQVVSAQTTLANANEDEADARDTYDEAVETYNNADSTVNELTGTSPKDSAKTAMETASKTLETYERSVTSARQALSSAWDSYNYAVSQFTAAKIQEENSLTSLYNQLITAQTSYLTAIDSYNAATLSVNQQLESYKLQISQAKAAANQSYSELQLADLQKQLSDCTITAAMDGIVSLGDTKVGTIASSATSLGTITDYSEMKIDIKIGEYDITGVEEGKEVTVTIDALDETLTGTITKIAKTATVSGGVSYFESEVEVEGSNSLRSGMSAEVKLITDSKSSALSISSGAVQTSDDGSYYVYVSGDSDEDIATKTITIGINDGSYVEVLSGLEEGDEILVPIQDEYAKLMEEMNTEVSVDDGEQ